MQEKIRKIKLFFASSVVEFEQDRKKLGAFIGRLNTIAIHHGIYFRLFLCEDESNAVVKNRKQEEYNREIRESHYFFALFGKNAGEYTIEECKIAKEQFDKTGFPSIHIYFMQQTEGQKPEQSIREFRKQLEDQGLPYRVIQDIDEVKYNMLQELVKVEPLSSLQEQKKEQIFQLLGVNL